MFEYNLQKRPKIKVGCKEQQTAEHDFGVGCSLVTKAGEDYEGSVSMRGIQSRLARAARDLCGGLRFTLGISY
jgi:hypothetical protein